MEISYDHVLEGFPGKGKFSMDPVLPKDPNAPNSGNRQFGGPYTRKLQFGSVLHKLVLACVGSAKLKLDQKSQVRLFFRVLGVFYMDAETDRGKVGQGVTNRVMAPRGRLFGCG